MTMDIFLLYLFTRLDALHDAAITVVVFGGMACLFLVMAVHIFEEKSCMKWAWRTGYLAVAAAFLAIAVPTQKDALFILAGVGVLEVAKADATKRIASKSVQVIEQFLDERLKKQ